MHEGRPLAYFSEVLAARHMDKSIYQKEYMALLNAVDKWRHYLQFKHFVIRIDHHSLKYLLEQRVTIAIQQKGLTKLLGLDYEIQYKKGAENRVADALSIQHENRGTNLPQVTAQVMAISTSVPSWMQEITSSYEGDPQSMDLIKSADS